MTPSSFAGLEFRVHHNYVPTASSKLPDFGCLLFREQIPENTARFSWNGDWGKLHKYNIKVLFVSIFQML